MAISVTKPTVGGSENTWGTTINTGIDTLVDALNGTSGTVAPNLSTLTINGTNVTATAAELNTLDGLTASTAELNKLDGLTASTTKLNTASTHYVPSGGIIMWSGSVANIPTGWVLCTGGNNTPNLRNRFVVGAGSLYAVGDTGGSSYVALSTANLPAHTHSSGTLGGSTNSTGSHTHSGTTNSTGNHTHTIDGGSGTVSDFFGGSDANYGAGIGSPAISTNSAGSHSHTLNVNSAGSHSHTVDVNSGSTGSAGSGTTHENRPPYYALAYIMKT